MATDLIKQLHDKLLEFQPDGAEHPGDCPICAGDGTSCDHPGGDMATYTQEELDEALSKAVTDMKTEIADLKSKLEKSQAEDAFAQEKAELEAKIADLEVKLDKAVLDGEAAKKELSETVAFLQQSVADAEAAEEAKAKKASRVAKMKEYAFTDEQIEERAERWASMADDEFDTYLADLEALGAPKKSAGESAGETKIPQETAFQNQAEKPGDAKTAMREVLSLRNRGINPATVRP